MQTKTVVLFLFTTETLEGYHHFTTFFLNFVPEQKKSCLDSYTFSLVDDCSYCHRHAVFHRFYLGLAFSHFF